ncbi:MAG: hypothetical protein FJX76_21800 [Armatimonadetes bacterium]|nr:hypothetical protein [Armatimonadota bacterium]
MRSRLLLLGWVIAIALAGCGGGSTGEASVEAAAGTLTSNGPSAAHNPAVNTTVVSSALAAADATIDPASYRVDFKVSSDWGSGFGGNVTISNTGAQKIQGWKLAFDFPHAINEIWNGRIVSQNGKRFVIQGETWNSYVDPGKSVSFGFNGSPGGGVTPPSGYALTGYVPPPSTPPPAGAVSATYATRDNWGSGSVGEIAIRNNSSTTVTSWTVKLDLDRTITNLWNARLAGRTGTVYTFTPESYNAQIAPGATVTFGFQGQPGNPVVSASQIVLTYNAGGTPTPTPTPTPAPTPTPTPPPTTKGYVSTQGSRLVDSNGNTVRLTGLNWFGLETSNFAPHGLWTRSLDSMLDQIAGLGYNCLRLPYCNQLFDAGATPNGIDFFKNPQLVGLNGLQIMDKVIEGCGKRGIRVMLDRHRPTSAGMSELWYTSEISEQRWINDWVMLATRYKGNPTVIACDLHNEPHGAATWGTGVASTDWRLAAERCGNAILAVNPDLLIVVEGVEVVDGHYYWWGGNLRAAGRAPVRLNVPNKLVYSPHDYPTSVYNQPWFSDPSYPANLAPLWDATWGYLAKQNTAPVLVGEFGTFYVKAVDRTWFETITAYMRDNNVNFTYWCWNPNSGDTGGILKDDWTTIHTDKQAVLHPLLAPLVP